MVTPLSVPTPVVTPPVAHASDDARASWHRPVGIGLFAGAGVALGLGVVGTILREGAVSRFNEGGCLLHPDRDELTTNTAACRDHLASTRTGAGMGIGSFVAAGVLAAAGVTVFLVAPRARETVQVSVDVDQRGAHGGAHRAVLTVAQVISSRKPCTCCKTARILGMSARALGTTMRNIRSRPTRPGSTGTIWADASAGSSKPPSGISAMPRPDTAH